MVTIASQTKNISFLDQVTRAETLWAINAARHGYSYLSCDESGDLFKTMFPDSDIAQKFKMERTKLSYMISHGLDPFSINQGVVTRYYKCILLGHAPTNIIRDSIVDSFRTDRIDIKRLLMIGRDNPNVNKTVEKLIDGELKKAGGELLKLGSCHIHMVHNAFKAGTTASYWHIQDFCIDIWSWFRHSPVRKEDFVKLCEELNEEVEKNILCFVCTRWVLLGKAVDQVL
ncbi:unnamed protein product, partial [Rotaria sp. Silwood1]